MNKDVEKGNDKCRGLEETVDAAGMDSFPASDPPAWSATHLGTPTEVRPGPEMFHEVVQRLRDDVHLLSGTIGERNDRSPGALENLERAASAIEERLREAELPVKRRPVNEWASNVEAVVHGGDLAAETVVVGAAYDTPRGSPGADDNASGVAALVALAHSLQDLRLARTVRLVAFAAEQPPHAGTEVSGSRRYVQELRREGPRVAAMMNLDALGLFPAKDRRWPLRLVPVLRSDLALVGDRSARALLEDAKRAFEEEASGIEIATVTFPLLFTGTRTSSHVSFMREGIPAFMVTDTAPLWPLEYDRARDTAERIDYERLGRATVALCRIVKHLATATPPAARASPRAPSARAARAARDA